MWISFVVGCVVCWLQPRSEILFAEVSNFLSLPVNAMRFLPVQYFSSSANVTLEPVSTFPSVTAFRFYPLGIVHLHTIRVSAPYRLLPTNPEGVRFGIGQLNGGKRLF
jgi:hypothetical protein